MSRQETNTDAQMANNHKKRCSIFIVTRETLKQNNDKPHFPHQISQCFLKTCICLIVSREHGMLILPLNKCGFQQLLGTLFSY